MNFTYYVFTFNLLIWGEGVLINSVSGYQVYLTEFEVG